MIPKVPEETTKIFPDGSISKFSMPLAIPVVCHNTVPEVDMQAKLEPTAPITISPAALNFIVLRIPAKSFPAASSITVHISLPSVSYFLTIIVPTSPW